MLHAICMRYGVKLNVTMCELYCYGIYICRWSPTGEILQSGALVQCKVQCNRCRLGKNVFQTWLRLVSQHNKYTYTYIYTISWDGDREREIWYIYILYSIHIIDTLWYSAFFPRHPIKEYKCKTCRAIAVGPRLEGSKYFEDPNSRPIVPSGK